MCIRDSCNLWLLSADRPSIVVMLRPPIWLTGKRHENTDLPSTCTMHAPHCPAPQPNLVPVSFRSSRRTQSSGVSGCAVTVCRFPLTVSDVLIIWDMAPPSTYSAITAGLVFVFLAVELF